MAERFKAAIVATQDGTGAASLDSSLTSAPKEMTAPEGAAEFKRDWLRLETQRNQHRPIPWSSATGGLRGSRCLVRGIISDAESLQALPMDKLIAAMKVMTEAVYPIIDDKNFLHHPYDPAMAEGAADVPLLIGNAATEATWFMGGDMKNFELQDADAQNPIARYLAIDSAETSRIMEAYQSTLKNPTAIDLLIANEHLHDPEQKS